MSAFCFRIMRWYLVQIEHFLDRRKRYAAPADRLDEFGPAIVKPGGAVENIHRPPVRRGEISIPGQFLKDRSNSRIVPTADGRKQMVLDVVAEMKMQVIQYRKRSYSHRSVDR